MLMSSSLWPGAGIYYLKLIKQGIEVQVYLPVRSKHEKVVGDGVGARPKDSCSRWRPVHTAPGEGHRLI